MAPPSFEHEGYVRLFPDRPALAAELLHEVFGVDLGAYIEARAEPGEVTDIQPAKRYADLVTHLIADGKPVRAVIVEVQLDPDDEKRFAWPMYVATQRAELPRFSRRSRPPHALNWRS